MKSKFLSELYRTYIRNCTTIKFWSKQQVLYLKFAPKYSIWVNMSYIPPLKMYVRVGCVSLVNMEETAGRRNTKTPSTDRKCIQFTSSDLNQDLMFFCFTAFSLSLSLTHTHTLRCTDSMCVCTYTQMVERGKLEQILLKCWLEFAVLWLTGRHVSFLLK